jgi:hypothetical protein
VELVHLYSNPEVRLDTLERLPLKATSAWRAHRPPVSKQTEIRLDPHQANALAAAYRGGKTISELAQGTARTARRSMHHCDGSMLGFVRVA